MGEWSGSMRDDLKKTAQERKKETDAPARNAKMPALGKMLLLAFLLLYVCVVFWYTVLSRPTAYFEPKPELFWSYREWFRGNWKIGGEILGNIAMFVPLGFFISSIAEKPKKAVLPVFASALLLSASIEAIQLMNMRGVCEWDDVFNNVSGAAAGWAAYAVLVRLAGGKGKAAAVFSVSLLIMAVCGAVYILKEDETANRQERYSQYFCFQIEEAENDGETLALTGFAFRCALKTANMRLILQSTETGRQIKCETLYGIPRDDVDRYFSGGRDYSGSGFRAFAKTGPDEEYEVLIQWPWTFPMHTGVFITGADIHYAPGAAFIPPEAEGTDLEEIVRNGCLRLYRPDWHCFVYQYRGELYWIAGPDFFFEDDGTTYVQYHAWTTQAEKLPGKEGETGLSSENLGAYFESHELTGNFGAYRVLKRPMPAAYPVVSIVTGYHKNGAWIWKNDFRPIYEFK